MTGTHGYDADPAEVQLLLESLCGDLLAERDPLIRYRALTSEQAQYDALVSRLKAERAKALNELKAGGLTYQQLADLAQLGTRQNAEKLARAAVPEKEPTA